MTVHVAHAVESERELARLLQVGVVLEKIVEARSYQYSSGTEELSDATLERQLAEARWESAEHHRTLEGLIDDLDAEAVAPDTVEELVRAEYGRRDDTAGRDDVLYDLLYGEVSAFAFYDDLIDSITRSDAEFGLDRAELVATLSEIRREEAEGVLEAGELVLDER